MCECPVVEISLGKAKGRCVSKVTGGKDVFLYSRLPFAKPPLGQLRFEAPVAPEPWGGLLDASKHSPTPLQDLKLMKFLGEKLPGTTDQKPEIYSEDCLYLSVYTSNPSNDANLPVLFWIYGGGFVAGGENYYDPSVLASLHDVIVITPNYRVNVFGFLSLGQHTDYPGNVGLLDQNMALKWTRNHIRAFGGDPDNVTIFGESAGAVSVNCHVVSPMSKGLFHRAISHSGSLYMGGFPRKSEPTSLLALAKELKLDEKNPTKVVEKLKSVLGEDIVKAIGVLQEKMINFNPVMDGKFIPKNASDLRKEPVANNVPYIIGFNNTESFGAMIWHLLKDFDEGISEDACMETLKGFIKAVSLPGLPDSAFDVIKEKYLKGKAKEDKTKWSKVYGDAAGDAMFVIPSLQTARHHLESRGKTYMYLMTQRPMYNHDPAYGPETARKATFCECDHADDLLFTMGIPLTNKQLTFDAKFTDDEKELSKEWMKYIVNFAKSGDPNLGLPVKTEWPQYHSNDQAYLSVQHPCSVGKKLKEEVSKFWEEVIQPMQN